MIKEEILELNNNNQEDTQEDIEEDREEQTDKKETGFLKKAKNLLTNKEIIKQIGKTGIASMASVAGLKSFYDVPAYFKQKFEVIKDKNEYNEIFANLGNENIDENNVEDKKVAEIVNLDQVDLMQDKIESMNVSEEIKNKLTQELNSLVENYHDNMETLKNGESEKLTDTLDEYVKTKISGVQASKEALNTLFVASGAYGLRAASYGALSVYERQQRLQQEADKEGREIDFMKDVVVGGVKEAFQNIAFKGDGTKRQKVLKAIKSFGSLARFTGIAETTLSAPENYDKMIDKVLDTLDGDTKWGDAGQNFIQNIENKIPFIGGVAEAEAGEMDIMKNMTEHQLKTFSTFKEWAKEMKAEDIYTDKELANMNILGGREDKAYEIFEKKTKLRLLDNFGKKIAEEGEIESFISKDGLEHIKATNKGLTYEYTTTDDGEIINEKLSGELKGAKWDYKINQWIMDKTHIVSSDTMESEDLYEQDNSELIEQVTENINLDFESEYFTDTGYKELIDVMKKIAGNQSEEACKQNMDLIKNEFNHYLSGKTTKENLENWCKNMNDKLKELGAKSDIINMEKLQTLKPKIISSGEIDFDAF